MACFNHTILIVDRSAATLAALRFVLDEEFEVRSAGNGAEALELARECGPFAAVLADQDLEGMPGIELLQEFRESWPDTVRLMLSSQADLPTAIEAVHKASVFRLLPKPVDADAVLEAVVEAVEAHAARERERLFTEQLAFARESLIDLAVSLERRLDRRFNALQGLQDLAMELNRVKTLDEVAQVSAERLSEMLGGRTVEVRLDSGDAPAGVRCTVGGELATRSLFHTLANSFGKVGLLRYDEFSPSGESLTDLERRVVASVSATIATATRNQISIKERIVAQHATIFGLAHLAENRDDETGKHLERVSEYCRLIAAHLATRGEHPEIDDRFIEDLVISAPLHDIGKVGIPDSILLKPGKLDAGEWEIMRTHPTIGAQTLQRVLAVSGEESFLRMGHDIAWCHHERWDGGGYPRGLEGEEIPLCARILSLADCYDALTTVRPYKDAWPHAEAQAYIEQQTGQQFDPRVVAAFLAQSTAFDTVRERLADSLETVAS